MSQSLADQLATTALSGGNAGFIEDLYEQFLKDPSGLDPAWVNYFKGLQGSGGEIAHGPIRERLLARVQQPLSAAAPSGAASDGASAKQGAVSRLIQVYANRGHLIANLDPLGLQERAKPYVLDLQYFGLSRRGSRYRILYRQPQSRHSGAHDAQEYSSRPQIHLHRHHRRGICARVGYRRAPLAAGQFPGRQNAAALQRQPRRKTFCGS